jgi:hypothetical protein
MSRYNDDPISFEKIETEIMKVITKSKGRFINQFELYDKLMDEFELKDPVLKYDFKTRFFIILKVLPSLFPKITLKNKNGIVSVGFDMDTDDFVVLNHTLEKEYEDRRSEVPKDYELTQIIIDDNNTEYLSMIDYLGNNVLHYLVMNNDYVRFKKVYKRPIISLYHKNNDGVTPFDLISDVRISNILLKDLKEEISELNNKLSILAKDNRFNNSKIDMNIGLLYFFILFISLFLFLFK